MGKPQPQQKRDHETLNVFVGRLAVFTLWMKQLIRIGKQRNFKGGLQQHINFEKARVRRTM